MRVEFRRQFSTPGLVLEHVIPDTGADASAIPWSDCEYNATGMRVTKLPLSPENVLRALKEAGKA